MKYFNKLVCGGLLLAAATDIFALPLVSGSMDMAGSFYALDASGARTGDANSAVAIDFDYFGMNIFKVAATDGDFIGLETVNSDLSTYGDIKDFSFAPLPASISDFWVVDIFSFELTDVMRTNNSSSFIDLTGTGVITATGFDATDATWAFSGDTSGGGIFSWSASSASVPEPGVLALLSCGLIGFGLRKIV